MLYLEDLIGINGNMKNIIEYSKNGKYLFYGIGGMLIKKNLETNEIIYKKIHDNTISSISIDPNNKLIATGQIGSKILKDSFSDVVISNFDDLSEIKRFKDFKIKIKQLKFNHDGKFLAIISEDNKISIFNTNEFYIVISQFFEFSFSEIQWGNYDLSEKFPKYTLIALNDLSVYQFNLNYELGSMKYKTKFEIFKNPNTGLKRDYSCSSIILSQNIILAGTTGGELSIFDISSKNFKAIIQIGKSSMQSMVKIDDNNIVCGFVDGNFSILNGNYLNWKIDYSNNLKLRINNLIYFDNIITAILENGDFYKINILNKNINLEINSNSIPINDIFYNSELNLFGTIDEIGDCKIWDIEKKIVTCFYKNYKVNNSNNGGNVIYIDKEKNCVIGYNDGNIKCFKIENQNEGTFLWEILPAHKGKVTSIYLNSNYLLSGGEDNLIRIWSRLNNKLITQINFHTKPISKVFPDFKNPNIIHSCSLDKQIHSFDLKTERKHQLHSVKNGMIYDMVQKKESEFELITCGFNNGIMFWDSDIVESTQNISYKQNVKSLQISPCNKFLAVGTHDSYIAIFDIKTQKLLSEIIGHSQGINRICWINSEKLISCSLDGSICIWKFKI